LSSDDKMVLIQKTRKSGQASVYSFLNARNREDAAQRLQRFVHWKVFFEETFHRAGSECPRDSDQNQSGFLQVGESHL
jgi:hypothetical protein